MDNLLLKDAFAAQLLRMPTNPFQAATLVFGSDTASAMRAASEWVSDTYVLARQAELLEEFGEETFLPSKLTLARRVWDMAETTTKDIKDRIKAYELYANIRGYIQKQTAIANVTNNTLVQNRVMVQKDFGTDEQWELTAAKQQSKLIDHARD